MTNIGGSQHLSLHFLKLDGLAEKRAGRYILEVWYKDKKMEPTLESDVPEWNQVVVIENFDVQTEIKVLVSRRGFLSRDHKYGGFKTAIKDGEDKKELGEVDKGNLSSEVKGISCALSFKACLQTPEESLGSLTAQAPRGSGNLSEESKLESAVGKVNDTAEFGKGAIESMEGILEKAQWFMDLVEKLSNVHPFAKIGFEVLTCVYKVYKHSRDVDRAVLDLIATMTDMFDLVKEATPDSSKLTGSIASTLLEIAKKSVECAYFVQAYCRQKKWERFGTSIFSDVNAKVTKLRAALFELNDRLRSQTGMATLKKVTGTHALLKEVEAGVKDVKNSVHDQVLREKLPHVRNGGGYLTVDEDRGCHRGTRTELLGSIDHWINTDFETPDDVEPSRLLLLTGLAGTGKSAVVHTLASRYQQVSSLGCAFFFHPTSDSHTYLGQILFPTIAHGLADLSEAFRSSLYNAVQAKHPKDVTNLREQYRRWIAEPLAHSGDLQERPIIIFIDGLDECHSETRKKILAVLTSWVADSGMPPNFRLVVTSRLGGSADAIAKLPYSKQINLSSPKFTESAYVDIKEFMTNRLTQFENGALESDELPRDWIDQLVTKSEGIFQWASTACNYIELEDCNSPHSRVEMLLAVDSQPSTIYVLDRLYTSVLRAIFQPDQNTIQRFLSAMGTICVLEQLLPVWTLEYLLPNPDDSNIILRLAAVIEFANTPDRPLRFMHSSFREFLMSEKFTQSDGPRTELGNEFWVGRTNVHQLSLTRTCLNLTVATRMKGDFTGASEALSEALRYAFRYWPVHYHKCDEPGKLELADDLNQFIWKRSLHWVHTLQKMDVEPDLFHALGEEQGDGIPGIVAGPEFMAMFEFQKYSKNVGMQDLLQRFLQSELLLSRIDCFDVLPVDEKAPLDYQAIVGKGKTVGLVKFTKPPFDTSKFESTFRKTEKTCDVTAVVAVRHNPAKKLVIISGWSNGSVTIQRHGPDASQPIEISRSKQPVAHIIASTPFSGWFVVVHKDGQLVSIKLQDGEKVEPRVLPIRTPSPVLVSSDARDSLIVMKNDMVAFLCSGPRHLLVWDCGEEKRLLSLALPVHIPEIGRILFQETPSGVPFTGLAVVTKEERKIYLCDATRVFNPEGFLPPTVQLRLLAVRKFAFLNGRVITACKWEEGVITAYERRYSDPLLFVAKEVVNEEV